MRADDSAIVFELRVRKNNDEISRYTYYQINNGVNLMIEVCRGKLVDGVEVWEEPSINFNTALSQMDILRNCFKKLLNGEDITPEDYIY